MTNSARQAPTELMLGDKHQCASDETTGRSGPGSIPAGALGLCPCVCRGLHDVVRTSGSGSSVGRAFDCRSKGRGFESRPLRQKIAQLGRAEGNPFGSRVRIPLFETACYAVLSGRKPTPGNAPCVPLRNDRLAGSIDAVRSGGDGRNRSRVGADSVSRMRSTAAATVPHRMFDTPQSQPYAHRLSASASSGAFPSFLRFARPGGDVQKKYTNAAVTEGVVSCCG